MPTIHGTYSTFLSSLNIGGGILNRIPIPDIPHPIGLLPVLRPRPLYRHKPLRHRQLGPRLGLPQIALNSLDDTATPRLYYPPVITRSSRRLLAVVHDAQAEQGLALHSESTLPSFALGMGSKLMYPPMPEYQNPPRDLRRMGGWRGGGVL
jgi:hypothetical protein